MAPDPDFTGYATRNGLKCADGRVIMAGAFKGNDGQKVPLVWQHGHKDSDNVLGHVLLKDVPDGVRAFGYFNSTQKAQNAKIAVQHNDITALSIYANRLIQKGPNVHHGNICEVSLVLSGANPGAYIDNVTIQHGDDEVLLDDEAIIYTDCELELAHHASGPNAQPSAMKDSEPAKGDKPSAENPDPDKDGDNDLFDPEDGGLDPDTATIADVIKTMTPEQQNVLYMLVAAAANQSSNTAAQSGIETSGDNVPTVAHSDKIGSKTVAEVLESMDEEQKNAVTALVVTAMNHSSTAGGDSGTNDNEGDPVPRNVFEQNNSTTAPEGYTLTHSDVKGILQAAIKGGSFKEACEEFAFAHGIDNIDTMFPPAQLINDQPDFITRRTEWVAGVLGSTRKSPFSRVKTILADITQAEARAKGYITGQMKREEFFGVTKRTTTPTTVYKKQKLDRDDILDITDFDVITWIKGEMRLMLDEEVARAILIGDGRDISDVDKIKDPAGASDGAGIRSVLNDHEIYVTTVSVPMDTIISSGAGANADSIVDAIVEAMRFYRGTGMPIFYTTLPILTKLLLAKDTLGRRLYATKADLASAMMVSDIQNVEPMEELSDVLGIVVNLADYNIGADKGGEVNWFDFFDIDFNAQKYLTETRLSGALVKFKSALVIKKVASGSTLVAPDAPTFVPSTGVVTIPAQTGVVYQNADTGATLTSGAQAALAAGATLNIEAVPDTGYYFADTYDDLWSFTRPES